MSAVGSKNSVLATIARYLAHHTSASDFIADQSFIDNRKHEALLKDAFLDICNINDVELRAELSADPVLLNEILNLCKTARRERAYELALYSTTWGLLGAILAASIAALYGGMQLFYPIFIWTVIPLTILGIITLVNYSLRTLNKFPDIIEDIKDKYHVKNIDSHSELGKVLVQLILEHQIAYKSAAKTDLKPDIVSKQPGAATGKINDHDTLEVLIEAIVRGETDTARSLLNSSVINVNLPGSDGRTALMEAAALDDDVIAAALIKQGADLEVLEQGKDGFNALMFAVVNRSVKCTELLIAAGAKLEARSADGLTALMLASQDQKIPAVALAELLKHATVYDINAQDNKGQTALMKAATAGKLDKIIILIEAGADKNIKDSAGKDALTYAKSFNHVTIVNYLLAERNKEST